MWDPTSLRSPEASGPSVRVTLSVCCAPGLPESLALVRVAGIGLGLRADGQPGPVSLWSSVPLLCGSLSPSLAQISLLLCLSCECRVNRLCVCSSITVNQSTCLSVSVTLGPWVSPWTTGHLVFQIPCPSTVSLSVFLSLGCQDSLSVPLDTRSALLSVFLAVSWLLPVCLSVFRSRHGLVHLLVCCSARGSRDCQFSGRPPLPAPPLPTPRLSLSVCVSHILGASICRSRRFRVCVLVPLHAPSQLWAKKHSSFQRLPRSCSIQEQPCTTASSLVFSVGPACRLWRATRQG